MGEVNFYPSPVHSCFPNTSQEAYINYKYLAGSSGLLLTLMLKLTHDFYLCLARWLGIISQCSILILLLLWLSGNSLLHPSSSQNSPILLTPPILPAWLLSNQHFIKPTPVIYLGSIQEHYPTASPHFLSNKRKVFNLNTVKLYITKIQSICF